MYLIEIFLPVLVDTARSKLENVQRVLVDKFGGVTLHINAPANGLWEGDGAVEADRIVVVEVMVDVLDLTWWRAYRTELEVQFDQDEIMMRATKTIQL